MILKALKQVFFYRPIRGIGRDRGSRIKKIAVEEHANDQGLENN